MVLANRIAGFLMRAIGAGANRLQLGRCRVVAAGRRHQELLDQAGARAARRRRFGVLADLVQREQSLVLDRAHDRALAHAIAATDFRAVGHRERARLALVSGVAEIRFAEHQAIAYFGDVLAVAEQFEVPRPVDGVAVEHAADEPIVFEHKLLVDAVAGVGEDDFLGAFAAGEIAGGE